MSDSKLTFAGVAQMIRPKARHRLLFAYDELMDADTIITPRAGYEVYGVTWELDEVAVTGLDLQFGVPSGVDRFGGFSRDEAGKLIVSEFYAYRNREFGRAHPDYLAVILEAARLHGFPDEYVDQIEGWDVDQQAA